LIDFKNTILIMTSNLSSELILKGTDDEGLLDEQTVEAVHQNLREHFKPEFLNRIDDLLFFASLSRKHMKQIVQKMLNNVCQRLVEQQIDLTFDEEVVDWLATKGYNPIYGARHLKRLIKREVETVIAERMIAGEIHAGTKINATIYHDALKLKTQD